MRVIGSTKYWDEIGKQAQAKKAAEVAIAEDAGDPSSAIGASAVRTAQGSPPCVGAESHSASEVPTPEKEGGPVREHRTSQKTTTERVPSMPNLHAVLKGTPTRVEAFPGEYGPQIRIHHGDFTLEGNARVVRSWLHSLRSEVLDAIARAEREEAA